MKVNFYMCLAAGLLMFTACKKDKVDNATTQGATTGTGTTTPPAATGTTLDLIKDSVYLYAKEDYYWNDQLPSYDAFKPRSYTGSDDLTALQNEVNAYSQLTTNPATSKPYEYYSPSPGEAKYSFIDEGETATRLSGNKTAATASSGDYGFAPFYNTANDLRVKYVYPGSPADAAGLKRGYQITAVNGSTAINGSNTTQYNFVVNAYTANTTITLTLKKPDGTTFNATVAASNYKVNPILKASVIDAGNGKKAGYIVFNSYVSLSNAQAGLDNAFTTFTNSGITDLIVDLRYNGGGYVETAEYIDNLIAPSSANGSVMYTAYYNSNLTNNNAPLLKNQVRRDEATNQLYNYTQVNYSVAGSQVNYAKKGALTSLPKVIFLVSGSTASASELTINNLRPYMNVQLIGTTTYGKPVGFFDIKINKYTLYTPEFETKNSAGQGGYYAGMTPGSTDYQGKIVKDDLTKDFGDITEGMLATALSYVKNGIYPATTSVQTESLNSSLSGDGLNNVNSRIEKNSFKGMLYQNHPKHK